MRAAVAAPGTAAVDRYHLCFALAKALEDEGEFAESFRYYELGNALKRPECRYRPEIIENNTQQQIEVCTREFFVERGGWGAPGADPIFIVGPAALRLDAARADPGLALAGRGHDRSFPTSSRSSARLRGRDPDPRGSALSTHPRAPECRGFPLARRGIPRRQRAPIAAASPFSSTRCRTTSATSGSFT